MTLVVALTGNIASGKSEVARLLVERGATVIDSDVVAREVVVPGTAAYRDIAERWGPVVLLPNGMIDRAALRRVVLASATEREALNAIVHPRVALRRAQLLVDARARGDKIVVCDIPLLYETGMERGFDRVILVDAPVAERRRRLLQRDLAAGEAESIMAAQMPPGEKRRRADYVIDNDGSLQDLDAKVAEVWSRLVASAAHVARPL